MTTTTRRPMTPEALRILYRPIDATRLGAEVRRLAGQGLKPRDIAAAFRMPLGDVLLALRHQEGAS